MGNASEALTSLEKGLPSKVSIDDAWLAKVSAQGNSLLGHLGDLKEKASNYIAAQLPNAPLPTPTPGSPLPDTNIIKKIDYAKKQISVATDSSKTVTTITKYVKMVTDMKKMIEEKYQNGMKSIEASKKKSLEGLTSEENKLFGNDVKKKLEKAKQKIQAEADKKKELIKVDIS